jgi:hypothetical protein
VRRVIVPLRQQSGGEVETCASLMHRVLAAVQQKARRAGLTLSLHGVVFDILVLTLPRQLIHSEKR